MYSNSEDTIRYIVTRSMTGCLAHDTAEFETLSDAREYLKDEYQYMKDEFMPDDYDIYEPAYKLRKKDIVRNNGLLCARNANGRNSDIVIEIFYVGS